MSDNQTSIRQKFSKFKRNPGNPLQFQLRDLKILELIYEYRFIPSDHITRLLGGSERNILTRLKKLFDHGYVDRMMDRKIQLRAGSDPMVYAITKKAADLLRDNGVKVPETNWVYLNRENKERYIKHTLLINKFRTTLTLAFNQADGQALSLWKENRGTGKNIDPDLSDRITIETGKGKEERRRINPDAFLVIKEQQFLHYLYLEADRSTMTNSRFLHKLIAYRTWWKQGGSKEKHGVENFRVITITRSIQRRDNLRNTAIATTPGKQGSGMFWFASETDFSIKEPNSILRPIWVTPKDNKLHYLLE